MSRATPLDYDKGWTPVRKGALYCSPMCGFGCTWEDYQRAHRLARELRDRIGGAWDIRVWENSRWHYQLTHGAPIGIGSGLIELHANHDYSDYDNPAKVSYSAWLQTSPQIIIHGEPGEDPVEVIAALRQAMRERARELQEMADMLARVAA